MKRSAQWNIADKEALLAAVEPFYEEQNRLPTMGSSRGTDDRALAYKYAKLCKHLEDQTMEKKPYTHAASKSPRIGTQKVQENHR